MCYAETNPAQQTEENDGMKTSTKVAAEASASITPPAAPEDHSVVPEYLRRRVTSISSSGDSSNSLHKDAAQQGQQQQQTTTTTTGTRTEVRKQRVEVTIKVNDRKIHPLFYGLPLAFLVTYATLQFSLWFPYVLAPHAATQTYVPAHYEYDPQISLFDNSVWTWGTDYALAIIMSIHAYRCLTAGTTTTSSQNNNAHPSRQLRLWSCGLLTCYAISVLAGGYAHQVYETIESRNSLSFRIIWTICVGTVTAAGGFIGVCGTYIAKGMHSQNERDYFLRIPTVPDWCWVYFAVHMTVVCALGGLSFQRPACDIFIAGTTQFPPTAYVVGQVLSRRWGRRRKNNNGDQQGAVKEANSTTTTTFTKGSSNPVDFVRPIYRVVHCVGFFLNAPLLPMYPLLVQYTNWELGSVNTLLHTWLLVAWSMQALSLRHFSLAINNSTLKP